MSSKAVVILSVCVVVWVQQIVAQAKGKKIDCAKEDYTILDKCCEIPIGNLAENEIMADCNPQKDKKLYSWINDFQMNKLQLTKKNNSIDLNDATTKNTFCQVANFTNCLFEKASLMFPNGTVNAEAAKDFLTAGREDPWKTLIADHITQMGNLEDYIPKKFEAKLPCPENPKKPKGKTVNVTMGPLVLVQFLQIGVVEMCPQPKNFTKKDKCNATLSTWKTCSNFLLDSLYSASSSPIKIKTQSFSSEKKSGTKKNIFSYLHDAKNNM
ncbi:uncharacterized protein LOC135945556 [Cloeon dipterum]|uniref:uncharacterized protein LOC135945556 n=1 Tax=Cloeon dipterum TaxID=197152 RepID=UPI00321FBF58